jgi:hypothetical protein
VNREDAKSLLVACRPNGADANDPRMAGALALVERDTELRAWFEAEQQSDKIISKKLKAAPLPEGLLEQIHAGARARIAASPLACADGGEEESDIAPDNVGWRWQPSRTLAMAASFALMGLIAVLWFNRTPVAAPGSFAAYRADMAQFLREFPRLDITTDRLPEVREWLQQQHPLTKVNLPKALEQFPSIGCRTVEWQGKKLALVCFMVEGQVVHLFVLPRNTFPDAGDHPKPVLAKVGSQNTASWSGSDNQYLLVTQADKELLEKLL